MSSHTCPVTRCNTIISDTQHLCRAHMAKVPKPIQKALSKAWEDGNRIAFREARIAAIAAAVQQPRSSRRKEAGPQLLFVPFVFFVVCLLQGCMVSRFNRETCSLRLPIPPAGQDWGNVAPKWERVRFSVYSCMADDKVSKIKVDHTTKTTSTGISIGSVDHEIDNEAVEAMTKGVTAAFLEALKHL